MNCPTGGLREVTRQKVADGIHPRNRSILKAAGPKVLLHQAAHRLPLGGTDAPLKAAIGDDFDVAVRQLNVDQHAVVGLGVPDAQVREHFQGMGARHDVVQDVSRRQRSFDREANLAAVRQLDSLDCLLDGIECGVREQHSRAPMRRRCVPDQASNLHHQLPEAPPPLNPPPPPLKPPPPPPKPPPPPPPSPPPKPPPNPPSPPPKPPPLVQPEREPPVSMANRNASKPAPMPMGIRWLKSQTMPPAKPPVAMDPINLPNMLRSTPPATTTTIKSTGSRFPKPPCRSHFLSGAGKGSPLTTEMI